MYDREANMFNLAERLIRGSVVLYLERAENAAILFGTSPDPTEPQPIALASWYTA